MILILRLKVFKVDVHEFSFDMSTTDMSSRQTELYDHKENCEIVPLHPFSC